MKQLLTIAPQNSFFGKFRQANRKTTLTEFFSSKSAGRRAAALSVIMLYHESFRGNVAKCVRTAIFYSYSYLPLVIHGELATSILTSNHPFRTFAKFFEKLI